MFKFKENTLECLRENFQAMVFSDKIIIGLFMVASNFDDEFYCPTSYGNLYAWADIKSDDWLLEKWKEFENDKDCDLTIKQKLECVRASLIEELKDIILDDIEY